MTAVAPVHDGVGIVGFTPNSPAALAGMHPNTVITSINNTPVHTYNEFVAALAAVQVNTTIPVVAYDPSTGQSLLYPVTPVERNPSTGRAVLGIYAFDVSTDYYHPLTNPDKFGGVTRAMFKDGIEGLVSRLRKGIPTEQRDRIVRGVSYTFAFLILGLVLWQLIGPRI